MLLLMNIYRPVPSVIALVVWLVTNFVLNIGRPVPWIVMLGCWNMWYRQEGRNGKAPIHR
jgi:ABC-type methionine transport system permease subunit